MYCSRLGIGRAKAILVAWPVDACNVFIVLPARSLNAKLQIINGASNQSASAKLYKAGADSVILPEMIGGTHMATLLSKPDVIAFIDFLSSEEGEAIHIVAVSYDQLPSQIRDKPLKFVMDWKKTGVNCIGVKDKKRQLPHQSARQNGYCQRHESNSAGHPRTNSGNEAECGRVGNGGTFNRRKRNRGSLSECRTDEQGIMISKGQL
jgi:hypothetical protein